MTEFALNESDQELLHLLAQMRERGETHLFRSKLPAELQKWEKERLEKSLIAMLGLGVIGKEEITNGPYAFGFPIYPEVLNKSRLVQVQKAHPDHVAKIQAWARDHRVIAGFIIAVAVIGGLAATANSVWDLVDRIVTATQSAPAQARP